MQDPDYVVLKTQIREEELEILRKHTLHIRGNQQIVLTNDSVHLKDFYLHYWAECNALICKACQEKSRLCRVDALSRLQDCHGLNFETKWKLHKLLDGIPSLAIISTDLETPYEYGMPQDLLPKPTTGWACTLCDNSENTQEIIHCHFSEHESLFDNKMPTKRAADISIQSIEGQPFQVGCSSLLNQGSWETPILLGHWREMNAIVCAVCKDTPVLARSNVFSHIGENHNDQGCFADHKYVKTFLDALQDVAENVEESKQDRKSTL